MITSDNRIEVIMIRNNSDLEVLMIRSEAMKRKLFLGTMSGLL